MRERQVVLEMELEARHVLDFSATKLSLTRNSKDSIDVLEVAPGSDVPHGLNKFSSNDALQSAVVVQETGNKQECRLE